MTSPDSIAAPDLPPVDQLALALQAAGLRRHLIGIEDGRVIATLILDRPNHLIPDFGRATSVSLPDAARTFEAALRREGIAATVTTTDVMEPETALQLTIGSIAEAPALAKVILGSLTGPYADAHRLSSALTTADIEAPSLRPHGDDIAIGHITADYALLLGEVLGESWPDDLDLNDWRDLDTLADGLAKVLTTTTGSTVPVESDPRCSQCLEPHKIVIGPIDSAQTRRLAARLTSRASAL